MMSLWRTCRPTAARPGSGSSHRTQERCALHLVVGPKTEAAFRMLRCRDDDVFVCSYPRCGLSWAHALSWHLLRSNESGQLPFRDATSVVGGGPVYHDQPPTKWTHQDVSAQAHPRLLWATAPLVVAPELPTRASSTDRHRPGPEGCGGVDVLPIETIGQSSGARSATTPALKELADACEALTLERCYDDFDAQKDVARARHGR